MKNTFPIQSPICGTYKELGNPIEVGNVVVGKQVLCFVGKEPVVAEEGGVIEEIFYQNGEKITQGTTLFMVKRSNAN